MANLINLLCKARKLTHRIKKISKEDTEKLTKKTLTVGNAGLVM